MNELRFPKCTEEGLNIIKMKTTTLYRPIGIKEYYLIKESGYQKFPPRLEWQPIFYPVLNQKYAEEIAGKWNTEDEFSGYCGLVTAFDVNAEYLKQFPTENVGGHHHNELWVPAEKMEEFNHNISGEIHVVNAFFGEKFNVNESKELEIYFKQYHGN